MPLAAAKRAAVLASAIARLVRLFSASAGGLGELRSDAVRSKAIVVRETLAELGPTAVKLGQNLGNRPDLVREDYMEELSTLQDRVPPFPNEEAFAIMRSQLGIADLDEVFSELSPEPVAAASIGQVYRGRLRSNGAEVAIKVQRPGVDQVCTLDLYWLRVLAERGLNALAKERLGVEATLLVDEFAEKLLEELDFEQEARNLVEFRANFAADERVTVPEPYMPLCRKRVLVMEWVDGQRCTAPGALAGREATRKFINLGVESGLKQLLEFGLFHGDPHAGNVLASTDGDLAYVDLGNVAQISRANQESLIDATVHAMNGDYEGLAADLVALGFVAPDVDIAPIAKSLEKVWGDSLSKAGLADFSFRRLTYAFNALLLMHPIRVPERFSLVIRALLTQEGICMQLDSSFRFLEVAFPYVARRLLTDPDPALRLRMLQVVIVEGEFRWDRLRTLLSMATMNNPDAMSGGKGGLLASLNLRMLAWESARMLSRDAELRTALLSGFEKRSTLSHAREFLGIVALVLGALGGAWAERAVLTARRGWRALAFTRWWRLRRRRRDSKDGTPPPQVALV